MTAQLAEFLTLVRLKKDISLRIVEKKTGISNAYLSQLERGIAENPSPAMLKKLADFYECEYEDLMRLAGYIGKKPTKTRDTQREAEIALMATGLNAEQVKKIMEYTQYVRQSSGKTKKAEN